MPGETVLRRAALGSAGLFAGLFVAVLVHRGPVGPDAAVESWIREQRDPAVARGMGLVARLGAREVLVPLAVVGGVALSRSRRSWWPLVLTVGTYVGTMIVVGPSKALLARPYPSDLAGVGRSFPSGHMAQAIAVYGTLAALLAVRASSPRVRAALWTGAASLSLLVFVAVMYRSAHWLTDMVAGGAVGSGWLAVALLIAAGRADRAPAVVPARRSAG